MTAVEWLEIQFQEWHSYINQIFEREFKQAKEMEKEQIIDAHLAGQNSAEEVDGQTEIQYYNETFRKN